MLDKHNPLSAPTNAAPSVGKMVSVTRPKIPNVATRNSSSNSSEGGTHFMCLLRRHSPGAVSDVDVAAPPSRASGYGALACGIMSAGFSLAPLQPSSPTVACVAAQDNPDDGGAGLLSPVLLYRARVNTEGDSASGILILGSFAVESPTSESVVAAPDQPTTRLQRGISNSKTYTDGLFIAVC